jgi:hypothetical protein
MGKSLGRLTHIGLASFYDLTTRLTSKRVCTVSRFRKRHQGTHRVVNKGKMAPKAAKGEYIETVSFYFSCLPPNVFYISKLGSMETTPR